MSSNILPHHLVELIWKISRDQTASPSRKSLRRSCQSQYSTMINTVLLSSASQVS